MLGASLTDVGNGTGEFTFTPFQSQAGQTFRFSVEARDGNGGTGYVSFEIEVPETVAAGDIVATPTSIADVDGQNGLDLLIAGDDSNGHPTTTLYLQQSDGSFSEAGAGLTAAGPAALLCGPAPGT